MGMYKGKKWCFCAANKKLYVMLVGRKKEAVLRKLRKIAESMKSPMNSADAANYMRRNLEAAKKM